MGYRGLKLLYSRHVMFRGGGGGQAVKPADLQVMQQKFSTTMDSLLGYWIHY